LLDSVAAGHRPEDIARDAEPTSRTRRSWVVRAVWIVAVVPVRRLRLIIVDHPKANIYPLNPGPTLAEGCGCGGRVHPFAGRFECRIEGSSLASPFAGPRQLAHSSIE
jgi:hypothetical protein